MNQAPSESQAKRCPLCGQSNACASDDISNCWCSDPGIKFTEALLAKIPQELRGKACICRACALQHQVKQAK